ncbi:hypothetical protein B0H19DRAFT_940881, partial [Mycena capillaripes]
QSANSAIKSRTRVCWSFVKSVPMVTASRIAATRVGLKGSVSRVNIDGSSPTIISGCSNPSSATSWTPCTGIGALLDRASSDTCTRWAANSCGDVFCSSSHARASSIAALAYCAISSTV